MTAALAFIAGLFVGTFVGVLLMVVVAINGDDEGD